MSFSRDDYRNRAELLGRSPEFIEATVQYAEALAGRNLPVIFSRYHFSKILGIDYDELNRIIKGRAECYQYYLIRKRSGGRRQIIAPHNNIRIIQQYLYHEILSKVRVHENATGFVKGKSILDNARIHENQEAILNIDLLKFFDTIQEKRVYGIFKSLGYAYNLCVDFAKLTTVVLPSEYMDEFTELERRAYEKLIKSGTAVLPQGAPTSPVISNLILRRLDRRLSKLAVKLNVNYSRYADDITFSGPLQSLPKIKLLRYIISNEGFNINWKKVKIKRKGSKQTVTNLTVSNNVHVHRDFKKDVQRQIRMCLTFGVKEHLLHQKIDRRFYREWLLGKIMFVKSIEPLNAEKLLTEFNKIQWPID